ncbi:hypothetical protein AGMMS49942_11280 [Spirochaetia bacterium]|nr:hypothetical protein AGMMS49942_11280 [Spirochaetia bacterium]
MERFFPGLLVLTLLSCSKPPVQVPGTPPAEYGLPPLALLQTGENPLWFELGENGPALIPSPEEASLCPFVPWPLGRRSAGILSRQGHLILGINREGFLVFMPWTGTVSPGIALYRIDNRDYWQHYSVESLFFFNDTPAAMIYRNDYFIDTDLPPPSPRVWGLQPAAGMGELEIPAFAELPPEEGWDLEDLKEGPDERWYYRAVKKGGAGRETKYFRTASLAHAGEPSSQWALQNASQPRTPEEAPAPLRQVLASIPGIAGVVSPEFPSLRYYAAPQAMNNMREDLQIYPGYYHRNGLLDRDTIALVISPAGGGVISQNGVIRPFALPPLPPGFVYTGIAAFTPETPADTVVLGTWEEQAGWNVGAAGFVLTGIPVLY